MNQDRTNWDIVIKDIDSPIPFIPKAHYLIMGTAPSALSDADISHRFVEHNFSVWHVGGNPPNVSLPQVVQDVISSFLAAMGGLDDDARDLVGRPIFVDGLWLGPSVTYDPDQFRETFGVSVRGMLRQGGDLVPSNLHPLPWLFPALAAGTLALLLLSRRFRA